MSAFIVWRLSVTPGLAPPRRRRVRPGRQPSSLRFEDTLEVTSLRAAEGGMGVPELAMLSGDGGEEPPPRRRSIVALTLAITLAAAAGAAALWTVGYYVSRLIAQISTK